MELHRYFFKRKKPQDKDLLNIVRLFIMTVIIVLDTCLIHTVASCRRISDVEKTFQVSEKREN